MIYKGCRIVQFYKWLAYFIQHSHRPGFKEARCMASRMLHESTLSPQNLPVDNKTLHKDLR